MKREAMAKPSNQLGGFAKSRPSFRVLATVVNVAFATGQRERNQNRNESQVQAPMTYEKGVI
jgi:hypothetical protein